MVVFTFLAGTACNEQDELSHESRRNQADKSQYLQYIHKQIAEQQGIATRSGDYSTSEAIAFLNEGLNFMYCRPDTGYAETMFYLDSLNLPRNGSGRVDEEDLEEALEDIAEFAGDHYYAEARGDKIPVMFNVRQIALTPSLFRIEATFVMEAGANSLTADVYPYEHEWIYGQWGSDVSEECNELEINADAADLFRRDLRKALVYRSKVDPPYYFKNPYTTCFSPAPNNCIAEEIPINIFPADFVVEDEDIYNEDDDIMNDNLFDRLLFYNYSGNPDFHTCLSVDEMNFHYDSMHYLAVGVLPNPIGNAVISQIEVGYEAHFGGTTSIFHSMMVIKAIKLVVIEEEFEEAIELP